MSKFFMTTSFSLLILSLATIADAETIRAKTIVASYQGFLQHPALGEDEYTVVLWKTDPRIPGPKEGIKIIFEEAVFDSIDSMGPIDDLQFKEVILRGGTFQIIGKKIICISLGSDDIVSVESLRLGAQESEIRLEQLALVVEGYLELGVQNSLLVYKQPAGDEFLEKIQYDEKTLWLNFPQDEDFVAKLIHDKKKVRVKVGWRQPESSEVVNGGNTSSGDYIAGYINISILE